MPEFEFRKKALARLSSPERLDELIRVVEPRTWLALAGLVALVVAALAWSFADELPQRSSSAGALVAPNSIIGVFVPESGLVTAVLITEGDEVDENQPIARLRSPRAR